MPMDEAGILIESEPSFPLGSMGRKACVTGYFTLFAKFSS